jgi:hypothetical protein
MLHPFIISWLRLSGGLYSYGGSFRVGRPGRLWHVRLASVLLTKYDVSPGAGQPLDKYPAAYCSGPTFSYSRHRIIPALFVLLWAIELGLYVYLTIYYLTANGSNLTPPELSCTLAR